MKTPLISNNKQPYQIHKKNLTSIVSVLKTSKTTCCWLLRQNIQGLVFNCPNIFNFSYQNVKIFIFFFLFLLSQSLFLDECRFSIFLLIAPSSYLLHFFTENDKLEDVITCVHTLLLIFRRLLINWPHKPGASPLTCWWKNTASHSFIDESQLHQVNQLEGENLKILFKLPNS